MLKNYELYVILDPELTATKRKKELDRLQSIIKKDVGGTNIELQEEGAKKLAYPIGKSQSGYYISIYFDLEYKKADQLSGIEKKINVSDAILRYLIVDESSYISQKDKESLNKEPLAKTHQELNKGKAKKSLPEHLGMRVIDYKDVEFLEQFTSPYHKIFGRTRTGTSAKMQRKINQAIKRARHMALMAFTPKHERKI